MHTGLPFVFAAWIFFALTAVALLRLRYMEPELVRPYRVWGYPWTPLIFLIAGIALTVNLWMITDTKGISRVTPVLNKMRWINGPLRSFNISTSS